MWIVQVRNLDSQIVMEQWDIQEAAGLNEPVDMGGQEEGKANNKMCFWCVCQGRIQ